MAVTVECPRCTHKQTIDAERAEKENPCKICHFLIQPGGAKAKPSGKTKLTSSAGPKTKLANAGIKAGAPTATKKSASDANVKTTPPKVNATKKRAKDDDDNDDDDDDRPRKSRRPTAKSTNGSSSTMYMVVGGGVAFLLLLMVCGGGLGVMLMMTGTKKEEAQIAQNIDPPIIADDAPKPVIVINPPGQMPQPFPQPIPQPQPIPPPIPRQPPQPVPPPQEQLDPNRPGDLDRVMELLIAPIPARGPGLQWLNSASPDHPRKAEVSKQLEHMFPEYFDAPLGNDGFFNPYFRWVTAENVPSLIRLAENSKFTVWDNRYRQEAMRILAKLKEPRGIPAIAKRVENHFDRGVALQALEEFGPAAQSEVLKLMNHPDGGARQAARQLLVKFNTPEGAKLTQAIADLGVQNPQQRDAAANYLTTAPVDAARRSEVSVALNKALGNLNGPFINGDLFRAVEKWHTPVNVPVLALMVETNRPGSREAMQALGKMRTPESMKVVAKQLGKSFEAFGSLREAGPAAEPAVIEVLGTTLDQRVRMDCVRLLGDIGTRNGGSLLVLQQITLRFPQDTFLRSQATTSSKRILSRP